MIKKGTRKGIKNGQRKLECSKCGEKNDRLPQRYCSLCHAAYRRANGPTYGELTPEQRAKNIARSIANVNIKRGKLVPAPCADCGAEMAEKHHEDYSKPLDVTWLCRPCHMQRHKKAA